MPHILQELTAEQERILRNLPVLETDDVSLFDLQELEDEGLIIKDQEIVSGYNFMWTDKGRRYVRGEE